MAKQIVKKTNRADKLVVKATNTFDAAIAKIEKANELLNSQVADQRHNISEDMAKIQEIQDNLSARNADIEDKLGKVAENSDLISKLQQFSTKA